MTPNRTLVGGLMMTDHGVPEAFSLFGDWFLPTSPERRLAGQLSYSQFRIELHLNGTFRPDVPQVLQVGSEYPIVYGLTQEGEVITLLHSRCIGRRSGTTSSSAQVESERLLAQFLLIGGHVNENSTYPEFSFRIPGLQVWLSREIIQQSVEVDDERSTVTHMYRVLDRKEESVYLPSIHSTLAWFIGYTSVVNPFLSIDVNTAGRFILRPDSSQRLYWYLGKYPKVATLLSIISGVPMFPDCMHLFLDVPLRTTCSVLFSLPGQRYWDQPRPQDLYLSCSDLGTQFSEILSRWFAAYDKIDIVSRLAASVLTAQNLWPHVEFLSLMHVLEGFHRSLCGGRVRLRRRLNDLAKNLSEVVRKRIFGNEDGTVPKQWVNTRNFYSHWDPKSKSNLLENDDLIYANLRMRHFLRALYLNLLRVPEEAIQRGVFGSSEDGRFLTHINQLKF